MSYKNYLVKFGDYTIPAGKFIKAESYSAYVNMQDIDPWTDGNGYLHRKAIKLKALKIEFETRAMLTNKDLSEFMRNIRRNYTDEVGREGIITAYIPEYDDYITQKSYLADFSPQIYGTYNGTVFYNPIRLAFVGGVYNA